MRRIFRMEEYRVLLYRILLVYFFFFIARLLFCLYNFKLLDIESLSEFLTLQYHGLAFDTTAILYLNGLFIVLSVLPLWYNTSKGYQKMLFYVYFVCNLIGFVTNFVDFIYYKYIFARTTTAVWDTLEHETGLSSMFSRFLLTYWHVTLLFIACSWLWVFLYKKVSVKNELPTQSKWVYFPVSIVCLLVIAAFSVAGIRGDFKKSTRPRNMVDANRYVTKIQHGDVVLNTPFSIMRTIGITGFKRVNWSEKNDAERYFKPIKNYQNNPVFTPNIVVFITESFGREYWGAFNQNTTIEDYVSYTPFLDSLAHHSLIFPNSFANGSKSIHGMSSVLAGIPSFKDAFTSSPYPNQKIQSLVSCLKEMGYDTSFFHGAPNGSMGFLGFGNILGFDHYYGKTEYNNDADFDGSWGIWDEPFMQFMKTTLDSKKNPFFATIFTVTSHEPYVVPKEYDGKFPKGTNAMHQCVGYTDYAFKRFFEEAQKQPWFKNTLFVITADHGNLKAYSEYYKPINLQAVPILFYKPDSNLKGINNSLAQQIDIYPTLMDMVGYNKPFRSWGRSLIGDNEVNPFVMNYGSNQFQMQRGKYICTFDGQKITGYYAIEDKGLEHNFISNPNAEMKETGKACKAFLQDYFDRIIDQKLYAE